jgi:hypothetical protein
MRTELTRHLSALPMILCLLAGSACDDQPPPDPGDGPVIDHVDHDGALHFASADAFFDAIDAAAGLSPAALDAWEARVGFESSRRAYARFVAELDRARTEGAQRALLLAYRDVFQVTGDELHPRIRAQGYAALANRAGIFYIDGVLHKITPDLVITIEDGTPAAADAVLALPQVSVAAATGTSLTLRAGVRVSRYTAEPDASEGAVTAEDWFVDACAASYSDTEQTSDRRLIFDMRTFRYEAGACCGDFDNRVRVEWQMRGYKKNLFGSWVSYNTAYDYRNVAFQMQTPIVTGYDGVRSIFYYALLGYTTAPGSSGDLSSWTLYAWVGDTVHNVLLDTPTFNKVHGEATSRGIDGRWARIQCGYCGDGTCQAFETASSCRADCGYCGDGVCYGSEDRASCPSDCGYCGDGICNGPETADTCYDCAGVCPAGYRTDIPLEPICPVAW